MDLRSVVPAAITAACLGVILSSPFLGRAPVKPEGAPAEVVETREEAAPADADWRRGQTILGEPSQRGLNPAAVRAKAGTVGEERLIFIDREPQNWLVHGGDYFESRWSPLDDINLDTVGGLGLAWSFDTQTTRGLEATPLVVDGVMFSTGTFSRVYANDAKTGDLLWEFDPEVPREWARRLCCDAVNRGVAVWAGKVYVGTLDGRLIALDAGNGDVQWQVNTIDRSKAYSITGAPRVVKGKVIIGNGGAEYGVRGYFSAYDAETGDLVWRFYTVPGDPSQPFEHKELAEAAKTWSGDAYWTYGGGGTVWDSMAYDPSLDMLYVGTGNGSPWNRDVRSPGGGDNLYLSSILAVRPDTGELVWHYQTTPGESWDYTATQTIILADMIITGRARKVLMQAPKNGFFYVIDRETGELISADPYVKVTWAEGVDPFTWRPVETEAASLRDRPQVLWPGPRGGHNWQPMAFNAKDRLVFIPALEEAGVYVGGTDFKPAPLAWNLGMDPGLFAQVLQSLPEMPPSTGYLKAWDPLARKVVWSVETPFVGNNGGVLTTAGDLVFQGLSDGRLVAYHTRTGERVWEADVQTGILAPPISYAVDGEQYIAVLAGWGGVGIAAAGSAQHPTAAQTYGNAGRLLAFKLGGTSVPPRAERAQPLPPEQPEIVVDDATLAEGARHYIERCMVCHGFGAASSGVLPDLRMMSAEVHGQFDAIVLDGTREAEGMPGFGDLLTPEQVKAIHAYIVSRAKLARAGAEIPPVSDKEEQVIP